MDRNESCKTSTCCFKNLSRVESIDRGSGLPSVMPIYNKISNKSDSCVRDGTTYYETLCPGTPEDRCSSFSGKTFKPNGCVSSGYNHGYEVKGTKWGTCGCDTSNGYYDSIETCRTNANSGGCMRSNVSGCYQTCKSRGYYSSKEACLNSGTINPDGSSYGSVTLQGTCSQLEDCYKFNVKGFYIRNNNKSTVSCCDNHGNCKTANISVYLLLQSNNRYATDINGKEVRSIAKPGGQYSADREYYLCGAYDNYNVPTQVRFNLDGVQFAGANINLNNGMYYADGRGTCKKISFTNGKVYTVFWTIESSRLYNGIYYTCKLQ